MLRDGNDAMSPTGKHIQHSHAVTMLPVTHLA